MAGARDGYRASVNFRTMAYWEAPLTMFGRWRLTISAAVQGESEPVVGKLTFEVTRDAATTRFSSTADGRLAIADAASALIFLRKMSFAVERVQLIEPTVTSSEVTRDHRRLARGCGVIRRTAACDRHIPR
jgi:hypothetical protein